MRITRSLIDIFSLKSLVIIAGLGTVILSDSLAQSREFLFNNGVNYLLADKEMAISQFSKALEIDPGFSAAYYYRGVANFKLGNYEKAISDFNKVTEIDSSIDMVHAFKGFAYRQLGENYKSLDSFNNYLDSQDSISGLDYKLLGKAKLKTGDLIGAIESFEAALAVNKDESQHYYLYQAFFGSQDYIKALEQIDQAIIEEDTFYGYYINRGNTRLMLGNFTEALDDYNYALELEPDIPDSYYLRGRVLDTLEQHTKAIDDYTIAIKLNPNDGTYYSKRGNARYSAGNHDGACTDWTIANKLGYYEDFDKIKTLCE